MLENTTNNTVTTRVNLDTNLLLTLVHVANLVGLNKAVFECNTLNDLLHISLGKRLIQSHLIDLALLVRGVGQRLGQIAVVGQKQHTQRVLIQTTYGVDTLGTSTLDDVHHRLGSVLVLNRRNKTLRLVQQDVDLLLAHHTALINAYLVGRQHLRTHLGNHNAIDRNLTIGNQIISLTARAQTRLSDITIQANLAVLSGSSKTGIRFGNLACAICSLGASGSLCRTLIVVAAAETTLLIALAETTRTLRAIERTTLAIEFAVVVAVLAVERTLLAITIECAAGTLLARLLRAERIIRSALRTIIITVEITLRTILTIERTIIVTTLAVLTVERTTLAIAIEIAVKATVLAITIERAAGTLLTRMLALEHGTIIARKVGVKRGTRTALIVAA